MIDEDGWCGRLRITGQRRARHAGALIAALTLVAALATAAAALVTAQRAWASFAPTFATETAGVQAGAYAPFAFTVTGGEPEEALGQLGVKLAPGMLGVLRNVRPCAAGQAQTGACTAASQIGRLSLGVGAGASPMPIPQAGGGEDPVYLTGPYNGAPFGLAMVVHAQSAPVALGQFVWRAAVAVDPRTAQVTITTDPPPGSVGGAPLDVRTLTVALDRPKFMRNPTSCEPLQTLATVGSAQGASASLSSPFQATGCASLGFKPSMEVSTSADASRLDGASLYVKITDRPGDAVAGWVRAVLPKQLPVRLTTLHKACPHEVFEANPAECDPESRVGFAKMGTRILASDMAGPAYLVSYGSAQFPELVIVFQGEGVTIDLHGENVINKEGILSSTFADIPDVPVRFFELTLPTGTDSALAGQGNFCKEKMKMPTTYVGENGAKLTIPAPIAVKDCRAKTAGHHRTAHRGRARRNSHAR